MLKRRLKTGRKPDIGLFCPQKNAPKLGTVSAILGHEDFPTGIIIFVKKFL